MRPTEMMKKSGYWCLKFYKKYCFNNSHFVKENRINLAVASSNVEPYASVTGTCQGEDMNKIFPFMYNFRSLSNFPTFF